MLDNCFKYVKTLCTVHIINEMLLFIIIYSNQLYRTFLYSSLYISRLIVYKFCFKFIFSAMPSNQNPHRFSAK